MVPPAATPVPKSAFPYLFSYLAALCAPPKDALGRCGHLSVLGFHALTFEEIPVHSFSPLFSSPVYLWLSLAFSPAMAVRQMLRGCSPLLRA